MRSKTFQHPGNRNRHPCNMATESTIMTLGQILRAENPESVEALTREAETLKAKLEEEKCIRSTDQTARNCKKNCFVVVVSNEMVKSNLPVFSKFFASNKSYFTREQCCVLHATKNVSLINYQTYFLLLF